MEDANRSLLGPVYAEDRRVQVWYLDYDPTTDVARLGYELIATPGNQTRERLGEAWYSLEEAHPLLPPAIWELACGELAKRRGH